MKNNTKIRLRLSKQLFESLASQVLAESKKDAMSGGAYTEAVKTPKNKGEKSSDSAPKASKAPKAAKPAKQTPSMPNMQSRKPAKKEGIAPQKQGTVQISLDEYVGDSGLYDLGKWVVDNYPAVAEALKSESQDIGQQMVDLGSQVLVLATVGTVAMGAGLAAAKDSVVAAAKKIKAKLTGGSKGSVAEMGGDSELDQILAKIPAEKKAVKNEVKK